MARMDIKNIENVEGKYHLMFFEGKNMIEAAKNELRYALVSLLLFVALVLVFVILSEFNFFYVGFLLVFLIMFSAICIFLHREKRRGIKQCILAVQNSKTSDIVARQIDTRKASKKMVKSCSNTIDRWDVREQYPNLKQKIKRRRKERHIAGIIMEFDEINHSKKKKRKQNEN